MCGNICFSYFDNFIDFEIFLCVNGFYYISYDNNYYILITFSFIDCGNVNFVKVTVLFNSVNSVVL